MKRTKREERSGWVEDIERGRWRRRGKRKQAVVKEGRKEKRGEWKHNILRRLDGWEAVGSSEKWGEKTMVRVNRKQ